jgi:hypothetical protein
MFKKMINQFDKIVKPKEVRGIQDLEQFKLNQAELQEEFEDAFKNDKGYTPEQLANDLTSNFKYDFMKKSFKLRFNDYVGKPKAVSRYVRHEILTHLIYIIFMIVFGLLSFIALKMESFFLFIQPVTLKTLIALTSFITCTSIISVIYKSVRISRYPNVYGILFGFRLSKVRVHRAIFTFIKRNKPNALGDYAPSYYNWSYDHDKGFVAKEKRELINHDDVKDEINDLAYSSNEHFIMTIHLLMLNHDIEKFNELNDEFDTAKLATKEDIDI